MLIVCEELGVFFFGYDFIFDLKIKFLFQEYIYGKCLCYEFIFSGRLFGRICLLDFDFLNRCVECQKEKIRVKFVCYEKILEDGDGGCVQVGWDFLGGMRVVDN